MSSAPFAEAWLPPRPSEPDPKASPGHVRHGAGIALLDRVLERPDLAEQRIGRGLRSDRRLGSKDRPWVGDALYGVVRRRRLLEHLLRASGWRGEDPAATLWWAWLVLTAGLPPGEAPGGGAWLDGCADPCQRLADWAADQPDPAVLATIGSLPDWLAAGLLEDRSFDEAMTEVLAQDRRAPVVLRVVTHRTTRQRVLDELGAAGIPASPGPWSPTAVRIEGRVHLAGLACWKAGQVSLQDEASQLIAALVAPDPGARVIDACAGAGGKSLALLGGGQRLQVLALDVRRGALEEARKRARREGVQLRTQAIAPDGAPPDRTRDADRVLVDAPCTGSGTLRRHAGLRWRWGGDQAADFPGRQAALLARWAQAVAPRGRLVYATCSLWRAENQDVIARFLRDHPDWHQVDGVAPADAPWRCAVDAAGNLRLSPAQHGTDGFFGAVLTRRRAV